MTTIILCGDPADRTVSVPLLAALERYGSVQYSSPLLLENRGRGNPDFFVYDCDTLPEVRPERGILLFKNSFKSHSKVHVPPGWLCVFESHNAHAAATLLGTGIAAATCGTGAKDTLSIASFDYDSAVLSLQRNIVTLTGGILEPHDVNVRLTARCSPRQVLSVCMLLMAAGIDSARGYTL